jgi:hypothetical protein
LWTGTLYGLGFDGDFGRGSAGLGSRLDLKLSIGVVTSETLFVIGSVSTWASFVFTLLADYLDIVDDENPPVWQAFS